MSEHKKFSKKKPNAVLIDADFRIKIEKTIENFVNNSIDMKYEFPALLTNVERAFVHNLAPKYNLKTKSEGHDENRKLSLFKLTENDEFVNRSVKIDVNPAALEILRRFQKDCVPLDKTTSRSQTEFKQKVVKAYAISRPPTVPAPSSADYRIQEKRRNLPIFTIREKILNAIETHRIVLIQGSTGSGKTTQIPQFILEQATEKSQPCRILCTQPRRISAIASADRVCYERSESDSETIGYQIRLESSVKPNTNCIFLTPGVFLRYLASGDSKQIFNNITHILIDEAHERAKENDFLLTSIKEHFNDNPNLRLIIMSATMDIGVFANYFGTCEEISIATKQYNVEEVFLENILKMVKFSNGRVEELNELYRSGKLVCGSQSAYVKEMDQKGTVLDEATICFLNEILDNLSTHENPESEFEQLTYLVQAEDIPVDFRHATTKMTALMIAVGRGLLAQAEMLLKLKADPKLRVFWKGTEIDSLDIANQMHGEGSEMRNLLEHYLDNSKSKVFTSSDVYDKNLLNIYYDTVLTTKSNNFVIEEGIDHDLIVQLIERIHFEASTDEAILVFLPGYDDIIQQSNLVKQRLRGNIALYLLHSSMRTEDQRNVFKPVMDGTRKIILSTNIAESSITIDSVVHVIDSGREKQKSYDAISHSSSLRVQWISKASANQRKGRAGRLRNGVVYRIYSNERYQSMLDTTIPELLRTSLTEICLQTKLMVGSTMKIEDFLQKCIATPSIASIRQSIKFLQCLGALDLNEDLTLLGSHLAPMPVDAKYAKMLIYGIVLKCLDSVLSIVSILSMGDQIFVLPIKPADRFKCHQIRRELGGTSMSDHFVMLKIFQKWLNMKNSHMNERRFCEDNFISSSAMEHVKGIRSQIMSYLQSSGLLKGSSDHNLNSANWSVIKACLCAGLYPNVARIDRKKRNMYSDIDQKLMFHMSSIVANKNDRTLEFVKSFPADWVVFEEKNRVGRIPMIRCNTIINTFSLSLSAGASLNVSSNGYMDDEPARKLVIKIDNLVTFEAGGEYGSLIVDLRERLDDLVLRLIESRNFQSQQGDEALIKTVASVLNIEERTSGFINVELEGVESKPTNGIYRSGYQNGSNSFQNARQPNQFNQRDRDQNSFNQRKEPKYPSNAIHRSGTFFANNAGPSKNTSFNQQSFVSSGNRKKFFALKMNSDRAVNDLASRILFDVEMLNLKQYMCQRLESMSAMQLQVTFIFYSTIRDEFLGYGDVMPSKNRDQPLQFHFRLAKKIPLNRLRQNISLFQNPTHQTEELSNDVGTSIVNLLLS